MGMIDQLFSRSMQSYENQRQQEMPLLDFLELCRRDPMAYATAAERMVAAIGEPEIIDTAKDARLGRIYMNRTIKVYPSFAEFFGMEDTIERIVNFFRFSDMRFGRTHSFESGTVILADSGRKRAAFTP